MKRNNAIRTIMTTDLVTVNPDTPLNKIQEIFGKSLFHHLPVVELGNRLRGIISREDTVRIFKKIAQNTTGKTNTTFVTDHLTAKDIMTEYPLTVDPDDSIGLAGDVFLANRYHALPIVEDEDVLVGLVTVHDLLAYAFGIGSEVAQDDKFDENKIVLGQ